MMKIRASQSRVFSETSGAPRGLISMRRDSVGAQQMSRPGEVLPGLKGGHEGTQS